MNNDTKPQEAAQEPLHDETGKLTLAGLRALRIARMSPQEHKTIDLGIKRFKNHLKMQGLPKSARNKLSAMFKDKAWGEYSEIVNHKGSFPSHRHCQ